LNVGQEEVVMRARNVVMIGVLLLPAVSSAQRMPQPRIGGRTPAQPVPLSPQPAPIARSTAYRRLNLSVETYPLVSYIQAPGMAGAGGASAWTTLGAGTRAEYRLSPLVSATMDVTTSFLGSPMHVQTAELGARFRPDRSERRLYPFIDVRAGFISAYNARLGTITDSPFGFPTPQLTYGTLYSRGVGGVAGAGVEYTLTETFSLTTGGSVLRSQMSSQDFTGNTAVVPSFALTSYRYTVGLKYNPVRTLRR
jgi:hypothetical protein